MEDEVVRTALIHIPTDGGLEKRHLHLRIAKDLPYSATPDDQMTNIRHLSRAKGEKLADFKNKIREAKFKVVSRMQK